IPAEVPKPAETTLPPTESTEIVAPIAESTAQTVTPITTPETTEQITSSPESAEKPVEQQEIVPPPKKVHFADSENLVSIHYYPKEPPSKIPEPSSTNWIAVAAIIAIVVGWIFLLAALYAGFGLNASLSGFPRWFTYLFNAMGPKGL